MEKLRLSPRQADVARFICRGLRKGEIAKELRVTEYTVRMHANALYRRLEVHDRVGVVVKLVLHARRLEGRKGRGAGP